MEMSRTTLRVVEAFGPIIVIIIGLLGGGAAAYSQFQLLSTGFAEFKQTMSPLLQLPKEINDLRGEMERLRIQFDGEKRLAELEGRVKFEEIRASITSLDNKIIAAEKNFETIWPRLRALDTNANIVVREVNTIKNKVESSFSKLKVEVNLGENISLVQPQRF